MSEVTLEARSIAKTFTTGHLHVPVLREVSVKFFAGELALIAGPSGSGKSTLLAILSGLMRPDRGGVRALGTSLADLGDVHRETFRLKHVGFVFQGFNLFAALTAFQQVLLPLNYMGISPDEARQRVQVALEDVGMAHRAGSKLADLSGGEQQRIAIARALAKRPELLFADEPTSALDAANGQEVVDLLREVAATRKTTVVVVSHDPRLVSHADRVLRMEDGRLDRTVIVGSAEGAA